MPTDLRMPLGGIDTGLIDLEANGTLGFMTIFNSHVPRRGPLNLLFLGLYIDNRTWVMTTQLLSPIDRVPDIYMHETEAYKVNWAEEIHYWGHYPVLDMEFEMSAPVGVGLRAWTPFIPGDLEWFEACTWAGMAAHVGGIHLANLKQAEAMAEYLGDTAFAENCREWLRLGSQSMENKMWAASYYLNYWEPATGKKSELVMANQLDGEWQMRLSGLPGVFQPERVKITLQTIRRTCIDLIPYGAVNFADLNGRPTTSGEGGCPPSNLREGGKEDGDGYINAGDGFNPSKVCGDS